jgi:hypothetical protein
MIRFGHLKTLFPIVILLASCGAPAQPVIPTATQAPSPVPSSTPVPTEIPTETVQPTATNIPGYEDWSVFNPQAVDIGIENDSLILTLKYRALWFMNQRGVLFHKPVSGDFKITANVYAAKSSDPSRPPGGDGSVQLGGLMARDGSGGLENYVFIVVGDDSNGLSVETKNTVDGASEYDGPSWGSAEAELRLCRSGQIFKLYKRHIGAGEPWLLTKTFERSDLPDTLQVGVNIYTDNTPDLRVRFEQLRIEPISAETDCEQD